MLRFSVWVSVNPNPNRSKFDSKSFGSSFFKASKSSSIVFLDESWPHHLLHTYYQSPSSISHAFGWFYFQSSAWNCFNITLIITLVLPSWFDKSRFSSLHVWKSNNTTDFYFYWRNSINSSSIVCKTSSEMNRNILSLDRIQAKQTFSPTSPWVTVHWCK